MLMMPSTYGFCNILCNILSARSMGVVREAVSASLMERKCSFSLVSSAFQNNTTQMIWWLSDNM